jgi:hypothetical protein
MSKYKSNETNRLKKHLLLFVSDSLDAIKWFTLSLLMLAFIFEANLQELVGINVYIVGLLYLVSLVFTVLVVPLFSSDKDS